MLFQSQLRPDQSAVVWLAEFGLLVLVVTVAAWSVARTGAPVHERVAFFLALVVVVSLSSSGWSRSYDEFRVFGDLYALSWVLVLGSARRLWPLGLLYAGAWLASAAHHVKVL